MEQREVLREASLIAEIARAKAQAAEIEATIQSFERSPEPSLRSIARAFRMLQRPFG